MNTELVIAYCTILEKNQLIIFLIKSVFCECANKKEKNITATYCKTNSKKRSKLVFKVIVIFIQTQLNGTLSFSVTYILLHHCYTTNNKDRSD